jgi:UDP-glucuronate 4-epimerase
VLCQIEINYDPSDMNILVTGSAGFIGMNLCNKLAELKFNNIVGLDNYHSFIWDLPSLKIERTNHLHKNISMIKGDICDSELIMSIFKEYKITHIINLAAQAGVRFSMEKPYDFVKDNVQCFVNILEQIRSLHELNDNNFPPPKLLYASSSSVYGLNENYPFSETDRVDRPSNLYGATKRENELFAASYFHLFKINSIGFRFFTVYGPWGRPDMAPYMFTERIFRGEPITIFNEGKMQRDFTYVDDIVNGVISAIGYKHDKPMIFNIGNSKPVETMYFVKLIENAVGKSANINFKISLADIPITFANTTLANQHLNFSATTSIETGIDKFVDWYKQRETKTMPCASECVIQQGVCFKSMWDIAANHSKSLTQGCSIIVFTSALGSQLSDINQGNTNVPVHCNIAFISAHSELSTISKYDKNYKGWSYILVDDSNISDGFIKEPRRASRVPKLSPGLFFSSSVHHAIYIDALKFTLILPPDELVAMTYKNSNTENSDKNMGNGKAVLLARRHPYSESVFSELKNIKAASNRRKFITSDIHKGVNQIEAYKMYQNNYQSLNFDQVLEGSLLVHDLIAKEGKDLRCTWYREYTKHVWSDRDQLSGSFTIGKKALDSGFKFDPNSPKPEWITVNKLNTLDTVTMKAHDPNTYIRLVLEPLTNRETVFRLEDDFISKNKSKLSFNFFYIFVTFIIFILVYRFARRKKLLK